MTHFKLNTIGGCCTDLWGEVYLMLTVPYYCEVYLMLTVPYYCEVYLMLTVPYYCELYLYSILSTRPLGIYVVKYSHLTLIG